MMMAMPGRSCGGEAPRTLRSLGTLPVAVEPG
jgi:hypothetical protein